jgi:hypothetical protein
MEDKMITKTSMIRWLLKISSGALFLAAILFLALAVLPAQPAAATCSDGLMYAVARNGTGADLYSVDANGVNTFLAQLSTTGPQFDALARHPTNCNMLYMISNNIRTPILYLYSYNLTTSTLTQIGNTGITPTTTNVDRLSFRNTTVLYALRGNTLFTIDLTTGAATSLGNLTGWTQTSAGGDIVFTADDQFFGVHQGSLYRINLGTMTATPICTGTPALPNAMTSIGVNSSDGRLQVYEWSGGSNPKYAHRINPLSDNTCQLDWITGWPKVYANSLEISDYSSSWTPLNPTAISLIQFSARGNPASYWVAGGIVLALAFALVLMRRRLVK